jgi:hypothetical protein
MVDNLINSFQGLLLRKNPAPPVVPAALQLGHLHHLNAVNVFSMKSNSLFSGIVQISERHVVPDDSHTVLSSYRMCSLTI